MRRNVFISSSDRPVAGARVRERAGDGLLDGGDVVAVDDLAGHPVAGGAVGDVLDGALRPPVGRERELVVLADEDDGQLPRRREVHPLVHRALAGGAVAEVRDRDLAGAVELRGQRGAAGVRDARADDPVAAEDVEREVGDVHRAAEALAVAGALAEHLGHHPAEVGAGRDQVAVRAVVADEVVRVAHRARGADGDRLLADAAVRGADDHACWKSSAARSSKRRIRCICRYCATRVVGDRAHRGALVELDDVAVGVVRVEALAAGVRAGAHLDRAVASGTRRRARRGRRRAPRCRSTKSAKWPVP